jgi:transposase-like protein
MRQPRPHSAAQAKRLEQLAAAVAAHCSGRPRRRLTDGLRAQVLAAIDAGVTVRAVSEACKVSASQITRWRQAAAGSGRDAASSSTAAFASPRVLSVVDRVTPQDTLLDGEIELRIGGWHVSLRRVVQ